jgi:hypothetical protein
VGARGKFTQTLNFSSCNNTKSVGFEVLTAVIKKSTVFWDITPCSQWKVKGRFGGTYRLHLQDQRISRARNQLDLFFNPEDGGDMFLLNVG